MPHANAAKGTITLGDLIAHAIGYLNMLTGMPKSRATSATGPPRSGWCL